MHRKSLYVLLGLGLLALPAFVSVQALVRAQGMTQVTITESEFQLAPGAYRFLCELQAQQALAPAASAALEADGTFDLQGFLRESVQCGVIVDFSREET